MKDFFDLLYLLAQFLYACIMHPVLTGSVLFVFGIFLVTKDINVVGSICTILGIVMILVPLIVNRNNVIDYLHSNRPI